MRAWVLGVLALTGVLLTAAGIVRYTPPEDEQKYIDSGIKLYLSRNVTMPPIYRQHNGQTVEYRSPTSRQELLRAFPDCCSFKSNDLEGYQLSQFTRWRYDFAGYVFIKAGLIKVSGPGPETIKSLDTVITFDTEQQDISHLFN